MDLSGFLFIYNQNPDHLIQKCLCVYLRNQWETIVVLSRRFKKIAADIYFKKSSACICEISGKLLVALPRRLRQLPLINLGLDVLKQPLVSKPDCSGSPERSEDL